MTHYENLSVANGKKEKKKKQKKRKKKKNAWFDFVFTFIVETKYWLQNIFSSHNVMFRYLWLLNFSLLFNLFDVTASVR